MRRQLAQLSAWLGLGLLVSACAILQTQACRQAVDPRSQAEVVARWGWPERVVAGTEGQTRWGPTGRAHIWAQPAGLVVTTPGWVGPGGWRCTQPLLRCDRRQVWRGRTARPC